jgi:hypothetical protein
MAIGIKVCYPCERVFESLSTSNTLEGGTCDSCGRSLYVYADFTVKLLDGTFDLAEYRNMADELKELITAGVLLEGGLDGWDR